MGYENRDYFRDGSYLGGGSGGFMDDAPMCKRILFATVIVFLLQMFWTRPAQLDDYRVQIERVERMQSEQSERMRSEQVASDQPYDSLANDYDSSHYDGVAFDEGMIDEFHFDPEQMIGMMPNVSVPEQWLKLDTEKVVKGGQVWRLITCAFCHARFGIWHIVVNMVMLYWFGRFVESTYGSKEFLIFYLCAAVVASLAFIGLELFTGNRFGAIGASGAVMAVVCVFALWNPTYTIRMYFLVPIQIQYLLLIYVLFDLHPVLLTLSGTPMPSGIAHAAHLGGLIFGFLYCQQRWQLAPYWDVVGDRLASLFGKTNRSTGNRNRKRIHDDGEKAATIPFPKKNQSSGSKASKSEQSERTQPAQPKPKTAADLRFDSEIDDILKKISDHGQDSLNERERRTLSLASKRYKSDR